MKFDDRTLRINSATLIFLTIISMVMLIGEMMANQFSVAANMQMTDTTEGMARTIMGICIGLFCLVFLMTLITGLQGIRQAGGKCKGGSQCCSGNHCACFKNFKCCGRYIFYCTGQDG